jgi:hypothetical protein
VIFLRLREDRVPGGREKIHMANRKQFLTDTAVDQELVKLLDEARRKPVTDEDLHEQRISFAFGNSPDSEFITKESVRKASHSILLAP